MAWIEITKDEYVAAFQKQPLAPFASFTDMDGIIPYGYGCPAADTEWGIRGEDEPILRIESRKKDRHDTKWTERFYKRQTSNPKHPHAYRYKATEKEL